MANQGYHVVGIELSPIACQNFFREQNITPIISEEKSYVKFSHGNIEMICGDIFKMDFHSLPPFHAVYDCQALIALPSKTRRKYIKLVSSVLKNDAKILLYSLESANNVLGPPYPLRSNEVINLYQPYFKSIEILENDSTNNFPERLIKKGFKNISYITYLIQK